MSEPLTYRELYGDRWRIRAVPVNQAFSAGAGRRPLEDAAEAVPRTAFACSLFLGAKWE